MIRRLLSLAKNAITRRRGIGSADDTVAKLYAEKDYLEAYSEHTDLRVEADPRSAIGGMWEEVGVLQLAFLRSKGLMPQHKLLDIGCGTLRGGRHMIRYLDAGKYYGMDISRKAIEHAKKLVQDEGLADKIPHLLVSENRALRFQEFADQTFDFLLAQSVFTHLKSEHIEECFEHVAKIMHDSSVFYFTSKATRRGRPSHKNFRYPFSYFQSLADKYGLSLEDCSADYDHPRDQRMAVVRRR